METKVVSMFHLVKSFITREKAPEVQNAGWGWSWRALGTTVQMRTWGVEGAVQKCENRVPLQKLHYIHHGPSGLGDPACGTGVPLPQNLAMPVFT